MKSFYIVHGCCDKEEFENPDIPSGSNFHWIPWLQKQLLIQGHNCQTPEMPRPYKPSYNAWKNIFDSFLINMDTTLIGHSCGCGFFLRYLSENPQKIRKLILVAPWLDPNRELGDFLKFSLHPQLGSYVGEMHILYSKDEPVNGVKQSVELIRNTYISSRYHEFESHGHFCLGEMGTDHFPELLSMTL